MSFRETLRDLLIAGTILTAFGCAGQYQPSIQFPLTPNGIKSEQVKEISSYSEITIGDEKAYSAELNNLSVLMFSRGIKNRDIKGESQELSTENYVLGLVKEGEDYLREIYVKGVSVDEFKNSFKVSINGEEFYAIRVREGELNKKGLTNYIFAPVNKTNLYDANGGVNVNSEFYRGVLINNEIFTLLTKPAPQRDGGLEKKVEPAPFAPKPETPEPSEKGYEVKPLQTPPTLPVQPQIPVQPTPAPSSVAPQTQENIQPQTELQSQRQETPYTIPEDNQRKIIEQPVDERMSIWYNGKRGDNDGDGSPVDYAGEYKLFNKSPFRVSLPEGATYLKKISNEGTGAKWIGELDGEYYFYIGGKWYKFDEQNSFRFSS